MSGLEKQCFVEVSSTVDTANITAVLVYGTERCLIWMILSYVKLGLLYTWFLFQYGFTINSEMKP